MSNLSHDTKIILLLIILITVFFWRELFTDRTIITFSLKNTYPWLENLDPERIDTSSMSSDCVLSYYPRRVFATEWIRKGKIPYWNHHQFCGTPFLANFQTAVFYPINIVLYAFDPPTQMDLFIYIHVVLAAIFTYLFGRRLGLSIVGSTLASFCFAFSETMSTRYGQPTMVSSASWLPLLLLLGKDLVENSDCKRIAFLSIGLFFTLLSGFPQIIIYNLIALIIYVLVLASATHGSPGKIARSVGALAISIVIGLLLACFQLLPSYEFSTFSFRKSLPYWIIATSAHRGLVFLKYFIPDILGNPIDLGDIAKYLHEARSGAGFSSNFVSTAGYVGVLPLLLAIISFLHPCRKRLPFLLISALTLLVVWKSPLLGFAYSFIPGFKFSRIDRAIVYYAFSMAMLSGFGFDDVLTSKDRRTHIVCICFIGFAIVLAFWLGTSGVDRIVSRIANMVEPSELRSAKNYLLGKVAVFVILSIVSAALVIAKRLGKVTGIAFLTLCLVLVLIDLLPRANKFKVTQPESEIVPKSEFVESLIKDKSQWRIAKYRADVIPANIATIYAIDDIHGYDALNLGHYIEFLGAVDSSIIAVENAMLRRRVGKISQISSLDSPLLDFLNVKYFLAAAAVEGKRARCIWWVNEGYLPRAILVDKPLFFSTYDEVLSHIRSGKFDPAREVLLVGENPKGFDESALQGSARIVYSDPGKMEVETDASKQCYLVISEAWYPSWKAYIDGKKVDLLRANYAFQAVFIPSGNHKVEFVFEAESLKLGILFSVAGATILFAMLGETRRVSLRRGEGKD